MKRPSPRARCKCQVSVWCACDVTRVHVRECVSCDGLLIDRTLIPFRQRLPFRVRASHPPAPRAPIHRIGPAPIARSRVAPPPSRPVRRMLRPSSHGPTPAHQQPTPLSLVDPLLAWTLHITATRGAIQAHPLASTHGATCTARATGQTQHATRRSSSQSAAAENRPPPPPLLRRLPSR